MKGNPTVVRWGDRRTVQEVPTGSVTEQQFVDLDLEEPAELLVTLTAACRPPMAGLSATWRLYWGGGAAMVVEQLTVPVADEAAPSPVTVRRSASKLRVSMVLSSTVAGIPRQVDVSAFAGPVLRWP